MRTSTWLQQKPTFSASLVFLTFCALVFGDVLFAPGQILGSGGVDAANYVFLREFGFRELRGGNLALWNPHLFSGTPFLGTFQTALLYPLNVVYLLLPLDKAVNADVVLHIFLTGLFAFWWFFRRGLHWLACVLAALLLMFGGPYFLKVHVGHYPPLAAMTWVPLILLAIDGFRDARSPGWWLLGTFAVTMQLLAGHPQTVFHTAVAAGLYIFFQSLKAARPLSFLAGTTGMYLFAAALSAVQLLTGMHTAAESTRTGGVPFAFAVGFALAPRNLLTLLSPDFYGNMTRFPFWGHWSLWENSLFMGVAGLMLALYGACCGAAGETVSAKDGSHGEERWVAGSDTAARKRAEELKHTRVAAILIIVLLLYFALADHTPLFTFLYNYVPGFNRFRAHGRFIVQIAVFLSLLSAFGLDRLLRRPLHVRRLALATLSTAAALFIYSTSLLRSPLETIAAGWQAMMQGIAATGESFYLLDHPPTVEFAGAAARFAATDLWCRALWLLIPGALLLCRHAKRWRSAVYGIALVAALEIVLFARESRATFTLAGVRPANVQPFLAHTPGGHRILQTYPGLNLSTYAAAAGGYDIWGFDPLIMARYAKFMAWSQGLAPSRVTHSIDVGTIQFHPIHRMLRARYFVTVPDKTGTTATGEASQVGSSQVKVQHLNGALPHLLLVPDWQVAKERDDVFSALQSTGFDPRREVVLESEPQFPIPAEITTTPDRDSVRLTSATTDELSIEATIFRPTILLVTDAYSSGWRAVPLSGSTQSSYQVMPANYALRGVPLAPGRHRLRLEYAPAAFETGRRISLLSLALYLGLLLWWGVKITRPATTNRRAHESRSPEGD